MADPITLGVIITGLVGAYKAYTEYKAAVARLCTFVGCLALGSLGRRAFGRMHDGGRVNGATPFADAPFELVASGERTNDAREKHRPVRLGAELIGELAALEMLEVHLVRRLSCCRHVTLPPCPNGCASSFSLSRERRSHHHLESAREPRAAATE